MPPQIDFSKYAQPPAAPANSIDFSKYAADATGGSALPQQQEAATVQQPPQRGMIGKAWDFINKGLVSSDQLRNAADTLVPVGDQSARPDNSSEALTKEINAPPSAWDVQHPTLGALRRGALGISRDTVDTLSGFTSPLSLATMAMGAAGKATGAVGKIARAMQAVTGAGLAGQGASDVYGAVTDKTAPPLNPDRVRRGLLGTAMAFGGTAAAADAGGPTARKLSAPMADTMNKVPAKGLTNPAEAITPAEVATFAKQKGVKLTAAQITENQGLRNVQSAGERSTFGGQAVRDLSDSAHGQVVREIQNMGQQMAPAATDTVTSGNLLRESIQKVLDQEQAKAQRNYDDVDAKAKGVGVDLRPVKQLAESLLDKNKFANENLSSTNPHAVRVLRELMDSPDKGSFADAQAIRSRLLEEALHPDNAISDEAQGWIKHMTGAVDDQMMTAATANPALEHSFRSANQHWANLQNDFNVRSSPLARSLSERAPENIPQKFMAKGTTGGSPTAVDLLDKYGIDKSPLKREVLNDLLDSNFGTKNNKMSGYGDDYLRKLYQPQELSDLYKSGRILRSVLKNTNTSGTAEVSGAMHDVSNPIGLGNLAKSLSAKFTTSDFMNNVMTRQPGAIASRFSKGGRIAPGALSAAVLSSRQR